MQKIVLKNNLMEEVDLLINEADLIIDDTIRNINYEIIMMYWRLGKLISEYKERNDSKHGDAVTKLFSEILSQKYGGGFGHTNIKYSVIFYNVFAKSPTSGFLEKELEGEVNFSKRPSTGDLGNSQPADYLKRKTNLSKFQLTGILEKSPPAGFLGKGQTSGFLEKVSPARLFRNTTWSHIREILILNDAEKIIYYINQIEIHKLTVKEIREEVKKCSYERVVAHQRKSIKNPSERGFKDPVVSGFENKKRTEKELEEEIIRNLSSFKREIGNSIMFYERQYKLVNNSITYRVDLVFYDRENRCFILIDLKMNKVKMQDVSQMQKYVELFNKYEKSDYDNKTIGIILCETKDNRVEVNDDIYQIKYLNEIPKKKELEKIIKENKIILLKSDSFI